MSSRLRSLGLTRISFFAFQDIITSVSGILILITLILSTDLEQPQEGQSVDADPELHQKLMVEKLFSVLILCQLKSVVP